MTLFYEEISLDEALSDYKANEDDIRMMELFVKNRWTQLNSYSTPTLLQEAIRMRQAIADVIRDRGGVVPQTDAERIAELEAENEKLRAQLPEIDPLALAKAQKEDEG